MIQPTRREMSQVLRVPTASVFRPLLRSARYKGAYGGRGSGKSHFFGELMVEECLLTPGALAVCIREVQKSLMQSSKRLIESKIQSLGVADRFTILHDRIVTPGDGLIIFQGMQDATAKSIKSLEGFRIAWVEEAQHSATEVCRCCARLFGLKDRSSGQTGDRRRREWVVIGRLDLKAMLDKRLYASLVQIPMRNFPFSSTHNLQR
jgi:phage terminase large subunit